MDLFDYGVLSKKRIRGYLSRYSSYKRAFFRLSFIYFFFLFFFFLLKIYNPSSPSSCFRCNRVSVTMMSKVKTVVSVTALFVVLVIPATNAVCPSTDQTLRSAIASCTRPVSSGYNAEQTLAFCNNSASQVIACVQTLVDDCSSITGVKGSAVLDAIDFENLKNSIETICNNTDVIEANAVCIDNQVETSTQCIYDELDEHRLKRALLQAKLFQEGVEWYKTEVTKSICLYREALRGCADHYRTHCGADVQSVYSAMFTAASIPNCDVILRSLGQTAEGPYDNCPKTAPETVAVMNHCTVGFRSVTNSATEIPPLDAILRFCENSAERTTGCLTHLQTCAEQFPVVKETLSSSLNVDAINNFTTFACSNRNFTRSMTPCLQPLEADANACAMKERTGYIQKIRSAQTEGRERGLVWFKETAARVGCEYLDGLKACIDPYRLQCSQRLGQIYDSLFSASGSPLCGGTQTATTTTTTTSTALPIQDGLFGGL